MLATIFLLSASKILLHYEIEKDCEMDDENRRESESAFCWTMERANTCQRL